MGKVIQSVIHTDLLIIGKGLAGLAAAITAVPSCSVVMVHKGTQNYSSTSLAQGGIAVALDKGDSPALHIKDTLYAGAGLCNQKAVNVLTKDGLQAVSEMLKMGVVFDRSEHGLSFTKEGAHSRNRILHYGDATGAEIERALGKYLLANQNDHLTIIPESRCLQLLVHRNRCYGAVFFDHKNQEYYAVVAADTLLATGGYVQIFKNNTNPPEITGDGIALAYAAGAKVQDMEFVQFHPTAFYEPQRKGSTVALISEAVRGEGAILRNTKLQRFMRQYHPQLELAPRDIVARAIWQEMQKTKAPYVLLDMSTVSLNLKERFPSIYKRCAEAGYDISKDLVPVVPAAHYTMGGIKTDLNGQTTIAHLYAAGETAATGVHGANRLASNSLLEALVFGRRAAQHVVRQEKQALLIPKAIEKVPFVKEINVKQRTRIQDICWQYVGIIRNAKGLRMAIKELAGMKREYNDPETNNLLTCAQLTARAALRRTESRGSHYRSDYPFKRFFWHRRITM